MTPEGITYRLAAYRYGVATDQLLVPNSYIEGVLLGGLLFVFAITTVVWLIVRARRSQRHDRR